MKTLIAFLMLMQTVSFAINPYVTTPTGEVKGRLVVVFDESLGPIQAQDQSGLALIGLPTLDALARQYNVHSLTRAFPHVSKPQHGEFLDLTRYYLLEFPLSVDLEAIAHDYAAQQGVLSTIFDRMIALDFVPNDPYWGSQWAMTTVQAATAFDYCQGSPAVKIGIVDSGTDTAHLDLRDNLWVNPGEDLNQNGIIEPFERNGVDDDSNGYADDFYGWNFFDDNNDVQDVSGHGTHCAGDASAVTDNGVGIASLGCKAKIITARHTNATQQFNMLASANGITYLADMGAKAISLSWGATIPLPLISSAISYAWGQGAAIFAAAGNNNSTVPLYPAADSIVVAVAATDSLDHKASISSYGTWVDLCAPGEYILGTIPNNTYITWSGTSFASPMTAGLAALILAVEPNWTNQQVITHIQNTCTNIDSLNPQYIGRLGSGRINAGQAIATLFPLNVTLTPINPPIVIPANGGSFQFNVTLNNNQTTSETFDVWIMVQLPSTAWYGPVLGPLSLTLPGSGSLTRLRTQNIPSTAPAGDYLYEARVGDYPDSIWASDSFPFTKLGAGVPGLGFGDWTNTGEDLIGGTRSVASASGSGTTPTTVVFPNPFNPTTVASFELRVASHVSLQIYDTAGRLMATLVDGWREAGEHQVTFDGSGLPSGVYVYRLEAGEQIAGGKMVLLK